jgi:serine/threonine protein kinase/WD40 repeat protein
MMTEMGPLVAPPNTGEAEGVLELNFGAYRIVRLLGEGGMGTVYLAEQQHPIRRQVALKVIKLGMSTTEVMTRFDSERQALALMDHPNIARVYDAGVSALGRPYFVMEHVPGVPITEYCDRNLLGFRERLLLFQQVCQAVQHAHQKGIIHRDLKPSNVLVTLRDGKPVPKVIDFGVAKAVNHQLTEKTALTETGMLIGTLEYMSPEQAGLTGLNIDTTTDVYSLGVLLYELLVGALPLDLRTLRKAGDAEIQRVIREEDPPRLTTRLGGMGSAAQEVARRRRSDLHGLLRMLRGDLEWITMKALEKNRTQRYASASELAADITRHLASEPVSAGQPTLGYRLGKFVRRHRGRVAAAAALFLTLLMGLIASTLLYFRANRDRTVAEWEGYRASLVAAKSEMDNARSEEARALLRRTPKSLRGIEWKYLYWLADTSLRTLNIEDAGQARIGFTSDGSRMFVSGGKFVHAWETGSFQRKGEYGPFAYIQAMTRDGSKLACEGIGPYSTTIDIVETFTGRLVATIENHKRRIVGYAFSSDGSRLVTLSRDNEIQVSDTNNGQTIQTIHGPSPDRRRNRYGHEMIAVSPDGRWLASSNYDQILLWDALRGREISVMHSLGPVRYLAFNADGTRLLSTGAGIRIWDRVTGNGISTLTTNTSRASTLATESPDGSLVADSTSYGAVHIWQRAPEALLTDSPPLAGPGPCASLAYSPDGKYLVCANSRKVRVWAGETGGQFLRTARSGITASALSANGNRLVVADGPELQVLNSQDGRVLNTGGDCGVGNIRAVAYHPQKDLVASGSGEGVVCIWNLGSGSSQMLYRGREPVTALTFSPDGIELVTATGELPLITETIRFCRLADGRIRLTRRTQGPGISSLGFSPDGRTLLVTRRYNPRVLWLDARSGEERSLEGTVEVTGTLSNGAFSNSGDYIAAGVIWDAHTGKRLSRLAGEGRYGYYAFSPAGDRVFAASSDGTLTIWRSSTGESVLRLYRQLGNELHFSPNGERLYDIAHEGIKIYDVNAVVPAEADEVFETLSARFPLYCDMREFVRQDRSVDAKLRDTLLRMLEGLHENDQAVNQLISPVLESANSGTAAYRQALRRCRMIVEDSPWNDMALFWLGVAQYRTGDYSGAINTLKQCAQLQKETAAWSALMMALAHQHLGNSAQAKKYLEMARPAVSTASDSDNMTLFLRELLREAQFLIVTKK